MSEVVMLSSGLTTVGAAPIDDPTVGLIEPATHDRGSAGGVSVDLMTTVDSGLRAALGL